MSDSDCIRCGTCCRKGGPSFHHKDKYLIEKGIILLKYIYTIRKGEMVYDNVKEKLQRTDSDILKIKSLKDSTTCIFFDEKENHCGIYQNRPIECRVLNCRDTQEIEQIYTKNRLTRKDILSNVKGLWELVEEHQKKCDDEVIRNFIKEIKDNGKKELMQHISEIIQYDTHIRSLVVEKGLIETEITEFLFGKPLTERASRFGLKSGNPNI